MSMTSRVRRTLATAAVAATLAVTFGTAPAFADGTLTYDFNTAGQLDENFDGYVSDGTIGQAVDGGVSGSGSISTNDSSADAIYTTKAGFTLGPVGASYTFSALMRSVGNGGYSGMGFTAQPASANNTTSSSVFRPTDAIGISVHGGGYVFHNGDDRFGNWDTGGGEGVTQVQNYTPGDLLNSGSPDNWYQVIFTIERTTASTLSAHVEVWPTDSSGAILNQTASAIYELNNITNDAISGASVIYSYINFSGNRVYNFDNYTIQLAGGASIVPAGSPTITVDNDTIGQGESAIFTVTDATAGQLICLYYDGQAGFCGPVTLSGPSDPFTWDVARGFAEQMLGVAATDSAVLTWRLYGTDNIAGDAVLDPEAYLAQVSLTVLPGDGEPSPSPSGGSTPASLATTGGSPVTTGLVAAGLLLAGAASFALMRRRSA